MMINNYIPVGPISVTSKNEFVNPDKNEANSIIDKTNKEHDRKHFTRYIFNSAPRKRDTMFDLEFTDKRKNKIVIKKVYKHCGIESKINSMVVA